MWACHSGIMIPYCPPVFTTYDNMCLSMDSHCTVYFQDTGVSRKKLSLNKTHNSYINTLTDMSIILHNHTQSCHNTITIITRVCYYIEWVMCCGCLSQSLWNVSNLICIMKKCWAHLHIWRKFLTLRSKMSSVIRLQNFGDWRTPPSVTIIRSLCMEENWCGSQSNTFQVP